MRRGADIWNGIIRILSASEKEDFMNISDLFEKIRIAISNCKASKKCNFLDLKAEIEDMFPGHETFIIENWKKILAYDEKSRFGNKSMVLSLVLFRIFYDSCSENNFLFGSPFYMTHYIMSTNRIPNILSSKAMDAIKEIPNALNSIHSKYSDLMKLLESTSSNFSPETSYLWQKFTNNDVKEYILSIIFNSFILLKFELLQCISSHYYEYLNELISRDEFEGGLRFLLVWIDPDPIINIIFLDNGFHSTIKKIEKALELTFIDTYKKMLVELAGIAKTVGDNLYEIKIKEFINNAENMFKVGV